MSMSTMVVGIKPPDEKWKQMKAAYLACEKAGISIPDAVDEFFSGEIPDDAGVIVDDLGKAVKSWHSDGCEGFEVTLSKLPADIKVLRFYNSW